MLTATLSGPSGAFNTTLPTGTIKFYENGNPISGTPTAVYNSTTGTVTYTLAYKPTAAGVQSITAAYLGDSTYDPALTATALSLTVGSSRLH
jgi:hypothetical protein